MARSRSFVLLLLLIPLFVVACGSDDSPSIGGESTASSSSTTTEAPAGGGMTISIKNFSFNPQELQVKVGDTVTITNDDTATHTWTADDGSFDAGEIAPGTTKTETFSKAGTVKYHCKIHTSMHGQVVVS
jgi:plastocyanin